MQKILVIKHSALGDFVLATGPMKAIRQAHANAHITLLTTKTYAGWGRDCGWFDDVWVDARPSMADIGSILALRNKLRIGNFDRVYDLQTSTRSSCYFYLIHPHAPEWVGIAPGCSHRHTNPNRTRMHTIDRQRDQLAVAGIADVELPDLNWLKGDISGFNLGNNFAILVPGGSPHRPQKRWPAEYFAKIANYLADAGITPVLIGAAADAEPIEQIAVLCPRVRNLMGQTDFGQIAALGRASRVSVGNDTGPMHMIAPGKNPAIVLFSADSDPDLCAPRGENVRILRESDLKNLHPVAVLAILGDILT